MCRFPAGNLHKTCITFIIKTDGMLNKQPFFSFLEEKRTGQLFKLMFYSQKILKNRLILRTCFVRKPY